jgi:glycine hydroxymethyltransferase
VSQSNFAALLMEGERRLRQNDPELYSLLDREVSRQGRVLAMVAASSTADPSVLVCEGSAVTNVTTEGYPGRRYHAGCEVVDGIERLAIQRACAAFGAEYANVQPHSGSSANCVVLFSLLRPGDTILGLELEAGGHLTHGAPASVSGQYFRAVSYGLNEAGRIDYDQAQRLAEEHRPRLIICGASAYPRTIDFARFREIADSVGAYLLADVSHISGLIVGGQHPSPIEHAHFTTTSTYKQLCGPRGGLILMGRDHDSPAPDGRGTLAESIQRAVFPYFQGTPNLSAIAAKARALALATTDEFRAMATLIVSDAEALARALERRTFDLVTGGTDNHIVLLDVLSSVGLTGTVAERALEECGVIVNKNKIPGDRKSALVTSGMRLGTNSLAIRGMRPEQMEECAQLITDILGAVEPVDDRAYKLSRETAVGFRQRAEALCDRFPISGYPGVIARP